MPSKIIVIAGPTGSGKTDLSLWLAERFSLPIVSADSRQVFRSMPIGTAQPTPEELSRAQHYLIANHEITDEYTAGHYEREALEVLGRLLETNPAAIVVGGSGLYIDALCYGMDELPNADPELRKQLEDRWRKEGPESLLDELRILDPDFYEKVDRANPKRVIRAIEVCLKSGAPYSALRSGRSRQRDFEILKICINMPREELYDRINRRVDRMMELGLEAEARTLYPQRELNALQTVGYREMFDYFDGTITREKAVELIKQNSRRYAKRQMTWFTKDHAMRWFAPADKEAISGAVEAFLVGWVE